MLVPDIDEVNRAEVLQEVRLVSRHPGRAVRRVMRPSDLLPSRSIADCKGSPNGSTVDEAGRSAGTASVRRDCAPSAMPRTLGRRSEWEVVETHASPSESTVRRSRTWSFVPSDQTSVPSHTWTTSSLVPVGHS
jgi:hypothetical protein